MNFESIQKLFPIKQHSIYLNNAAETVMNQRVYDRLQEYLDWSLREPQSKPLIRDAVKEQLTNIFGGKAENYALTTSTGHGIGMVASGYNWKSGDNIILPADEHWNNIFPWMNLAKRRVEIRLLEVEPDQRIDLKKLENLVDERTKIIAVTAVRFNTGYRMNLKEISKIAQRHNILFVVDAIQAAGVCPINIKQDGMDVLASAGFKWLLGVQGTGFLYLNKRAQKLIDPVIPGMFAAKLQTRKLELHNDARKYETGTIAYSLFYAWIAGLELLQEIGIDNIHSRIMHLTDRIIAGLKQKNISIVTPLEQISERSGIISFDLGNHTLNRELQSKLLDHKINVAFRDGRIRISPNFYNDESEIDKFLELL